jgi:hypothetical protein
VARDGFAQERLVAVYPSRREADEVVAQLRRVGLDEQQVRLGDPNDQAAALYGEMREETSQSWPGIPIGPHTKEQAKGATAGVAAGVGFGLVIGILVGLIPWQGVAIGPRLLIGLAVGIVAGTTIGYIVGGGLNARGPAEVGAAQGVPVSVSSTDQAALDALTSQHALRIDRVGAGGAPITPVHTEEDDDDRSEVGRLTDRLRQPPGGDWSTTNADEPREGEQA